MLKPNEDLLRSLGYVPEEMTEARKKDVVANAILNMLRKEGCQPYHNGQVIYWKPAPTMAAIDLPACVAEVKDELLAALASENWFAIGDAIVLVEGALKKLRPAIPGRPNRDFTDAVVGELTAIAEALLKLSQRFCEHDQVGPSDFHKGMH